MMPECHKCQFNGKGSNACLKCIDQPMHLTNYFRNFVSFENSFEAHNLTSKQYFEDALNAREPDNDNNLIEDMALIAYWQRLDALPLVAVCVLEAYRRGLHYPEISKIFKVSTARISQIIADAEKIDKTLISVVRKHNNRRYTQHKRDNNEPSFFDKLGF